MSEHQPDTDLIPLRWRLALLVIAVVANAAVVCHELWGAYGHAAH